MSTALYMSRLGLQEQRILIIDQDEKITNDRTWCFWSDGDHPFKDIVSHSWPQITFTDDIGTIASDMANYQYHLIRGIDFYRKVRTELEKNPNIHFLKDKVEQIYPAEQGTTLVWTTTKGFTADCVLNSIYQAPSINATPNHYHLLQHFKGWWVKTDDACFNPQEARLMDFSIDQQKDCRFMYLLPISKHKALVEFTVFSERTLPKAAYREQLRLYIEKQLNISGYEICEEEQGIIPMTNQVLSRFTGAGIIPIGTAAGWVKPSTGYAFLNIQQKSKQLAQAILHGKEWPVAQAQNRFHFYDNLLLHLLSQQGSKGKGIFSALFRKNPMHRILTFLNEQSSLKEEVLIFSGLPVGPFLMALWQRSINRWMKNEKPFFSTSKERMDSLRIGGSSEEAL